jgi:hypothetical protein
VDSLDFPFLKEDVRIRLRVLKTLGLVYQLKMKNVLLVGVSITKTVQVKLADLDRNGRFR